METGRVHAGLVASTLAVAPARAVGNVDIRALPPPAAAPERSVAGAEPVESERFLATEFFESHPGFSPDGCWIAYDSDESGRFEVYVRPYPGPGGKQQVSVDGGRFAVWSTEANELFYLGGDRIRAVAYAVSGGTFSAARPRTIVELPASPSASVPEFYFARLDAPDGRRFVVLQSALTDRLEELARPTIVLNWFAELKRQVPTTD